MELLKLTAVELRNTDLDRFMSEWQVSKRSHC